MTAIAQLRVVQAGPHVSIQDGGRFGLMRYGVPASGPMDMLALAAANHALGRPRGAAGVEVSLGGLVLDCVAGAVTVALAGAGFITDHAGVLSGSWHVLTLRAGERLAIRPGFWGAWAYLALAGDLDCPRWLGHAATHALSGLGGGRLVAGAELHIDAATVLPGHDGPIPCPVLARPTGRARVVPGPQDQHFLAQTMATFLATPFRVTSASDRMGIRLAGPPLPLRAALSIPSEPILRGSVQVAGDGVATVLMADHQTTGGYPKIATVISADLDGIAQLRPGDLLRFQPVTPAQAIALTRQHAIRSERYLAGLGRHRFGPG